MTLDKYLIIAECLSQEQKPYEDAISRQAALDAIMGEPTDAHYPSWYARRIEDLPPVHAVPKTGHWIITDSNDPFLYMCSECHRRMDDKEPYCPSCGIKMSEEEI
jgi:hypothetical protein